MDSLAFALRYEGRKRVNHADETMARITADRLVRHLAEVRVRVDAAAGRGGEFRMGGDHGAFVLVEGFKISRR